GKTEMWYVLEANRGSTLLSGVGDDVTRDSFLKELPTGNIAKLLHSFPVSKGDSVFVAAGTVHAIGEGILLAEIQQNSDITYRLFDWNRVDAQGNTRELHTEKALKVMDFAHAAADSTKVLSYTEQGVTHEVLAACPYFAAERLIAEGTSKFETAGKSFHILQALDMPVGVLAGDSKCVLAYGEAALIPANTGTWSITGGSPLLHYYVPDLQEDIIAPLRRHGHSTEKIYGIGGLHRS
ncbi:MAG: class I mannose-6-phosphate isomerase, partial [Candidatus Hydrogenedentes bacterium]|nr:class I mannose-6-phosphate isomerase [Candidatus Hydrogenedentota bacterium]